MLLNRSGSAPEREKNDQTRPIAKNVQTWSQYAEVSVRIWEILASPSKDMQYVNAGIKCGRL